MKPNQTKVLCFLAVGCVCVIFLSLLPILLSPEPPAGSFDLRIADTPQITNGAMLITLVLSNGTSRRFNIVDDTAGKPFFVLDDGAPVSGTIGVGLSRMANMLKINLSPGEAMTNAIMLTNPPLRFRFRAEARDLASERHININELIRLAASKVIHRKPGPYTTTTMILPTSPWIDASLVSTTNPAATVQNPGP
jgi:hypothetical protein